MPKLTLLFPFNVKEQQHYSEFPPDAQAPHLIPKPEASHPPKESYFSCICLQSHSFGQYQKLVTMGVDWNEDGPVYVKRHLLAPF